MKPRNGMKPGDVSSKALGRLEARVSLGNKDALPYASLVEVAANQVVLNQERSKVPLIAELFSVTPIHTAYARDMRSLEDLIRAKLAIDRALENALFIDMSKKEPK